MSLVKNLIVITDEFVEAVMRFFNYIYILNFLANPFLFVKLFFNFFGKLLISFTAASEGSHFMKLSSPVIFEQILLFNFILY